MTSVIVKVTVLAHGTGLQLPAYKTEDAAGCDLAAAVPQNEPVVIQPGERVLVPTGIAIALPPGHEGQVRPRSGLSVDHGVTVLNAPGTIDADYRGEIRVPIINHGANAFTIMRGMRIAQLIIAPVTRATFIETDTLNSTNRGGGGFGSTGLAD